MWLWKLFTYIINLPPLLLWLLTISGSLFEAGFIATVSAWAWRCKRTVLLLSSPGRDCFPSVGWSSPKTAGCIICHGCQPTQVREAAGNHWSAGRFHPNFSQLDRRDRRSLGRLWVAVDLQRLVSLPRVGRQLSEPALNRKSWIPELWPPKLLTEIFLKV